MARLWSNASEAATTTIIRYARNALDDSREMFEGPTPESSPQLARFPADNANRISTRHHARTRHIFSGRHPRTRIERQTATAYFRWRAASAEFCDQARCLH